MARTIIYVINFTQDKQNLPKQAEGKGTYTKVIEETPHIYQYITLVFTKIINKRPVTGSSGNGSIPMPQWKGRGGGQELSAEVIRAPV